VALEKSSPKTGSSAFYQKKASSWKQADLRDMFKKASKSVCSSTIAASPDLLCHAPSISSAIKTPENTVEDPDDPYLADERNVQVEYSSD
jgi:hypothetical protein